MANLVGAASVGVLVLVLGGGQGCGGAKFTATDGGVGDASGGTDGATADAAPQCILPPNGVGNERDFCNVYASQLSACRNCESCYQLDANACVAIGDTLSAGSKSALVACQSTLGCDNLTSYANNACVRTHLQATPLTATQTQVKQAYCNKCPTNIVECQNFFLLNGDAGDKSGLGIWALLLNDALGQQIINTCSGNNPKCDAFGYGICGALVLCGAAPHSNCPKGLCK
jgi:hypothetical protein